MFNKDKILGLKAGEYMDELIAIHIFNKVKGIDFGEFPEHKWRLNEDGEIDNFSFDINYCNGPTCTRCNYSFCVHCNPDGYNNGPSCVEDAPSYSTYIFLGGLVELLDKAKVKPSIVRTEDGKWCVALNMISENLAELICKYLLIEREIEV